MDRRKIGLLLGGLVGLSVAVVLWLDRSEPPAPKKTDHVAPVLPAPPDAGPSREELEARLEQLRERRDGAQGVVDRATRGAPIEPMTVDAARRDVEAMIVEIEAAERELKQLDQDTD